MNCQLGLRQGRAVTRENMLNVDIRQLRWVGTVPCHLLSGEVSSPQNGSGLTLRNNPCKEKSQLPSQQVEADVLSRSKNSAYLLVRQILSPLGKGTTVPKELHGNKARKLATPFLKPRALVTLGPLPLSVPHSRMGHLGTRDPAGI